MPPPPLLTKMAGQGHKLRVVHSCYDNLKIWPIVVTLKEFGVLALVDHISLLYSRCRGELEPVLPLKLQDG